MNKLYNDDCFNILPLIDKKSIHMVIVDLPYGQTCNEWDKKIDLNKMWDYLKDICIDNCQYIFFTTTKFGIDLINSNPSWFKYDLIWEKTNAVGFLNANKMPLRSHEMIYIFNNPKGRNRCYNPQKIEGKPYSNPNKCGLSDNYGITERIPTENKDGKRFPTSIIKIKSCRQKTIHPTQKPLELCEWLIKTFSNEGDNILDFCMGSGSSIIACKNTGRNYIGIEMNKEIYDKAVERINS